MRRTIVRIKPLHFNEIHRLGFLPQRAVLLGVLAQVTELDPPSSLASTSKSLSLN